MELALAERREEGGSREGVVRREEWRRRGSGGLQHTQLEATHWSAPAHTYGKVVEGVSCLGSDGRSLRARRQVEVLSARGPGVVQVLTSSHTTSRSQSSTSIHKNFDDLNLSVNPLDLSTQKDRLSIGRSGAMGTRRPPTKLRPQITDGNSTVSKLCHWFDMDSQQKLQSPTIVATNGCHAKSDDQPNEENKSSKESEDSLYDSCPERESVFRDETEQLEEWRRASKVRRSLQYPSKSMRYSSKPLDLPDNWGSVSRIKKELENSWFSKTPKSTHLSILDDDIFTDKTNKSRPENIAEEPESGALVPDDDFLIKPSVFKKKSFVDTDTLNELRGRLKSVAKDKPVSLNDLDDGIETEDQDKKNDSTTIPSVRSYVFGMEAALGSSTQNKSNYSSGTNSLESRVSKLINGASNRSDDWHTRRKSYGFERVQNSQKISNHLLSSHEKNNMESSTDSGICRSSEVVNKSDSSAQLNRGTVITLGNNEKQESFETWLMNNRKPIVGPFSRVKDSDYKNNTLIARSTNQISISIPHKQLPLESYRESTEPVLRIAEEGDSFKSGPLVSSTISLLSKNEDYALKRHTIAVDGFKTLNQITTDLNGDMSERKNKKVGFCKTEVHFTADSGKVNIVETDGKPPSTNNFRRRRKSSSTFKDSTEKSTLPITHFGDSENTKNDDTTEGFDIKDGFKLNYAIITEIKSVTKEAEKSKDAVENSGIVNEDLSEADQPRGILKNKPIKPKPYHLGEDMNVLSEINSNGQTVEENNVWGVKLKPIQNKSDAPLWCSSVTLKSDSFSNKIDAEKEQNIYGKINEGLVTKTDTVQKSQTETKGYKTKINFGNGDATVESSYKDSTTTQKEAQACQKRYIDSNESKIVSKYLPADTNTYKEKQFREDEARNEMTMVQKIKKSLNLNEPKPCEIKESNSLTFADTASTPRSLMPTRGSARKLKEHELSYFGIKNSSSTSIKDYNESSNSLKKQVQKPQTFMETLNMSFDTKPYIKPSSYIMSDVNYPIADNKNDSYDKNPIYENISMHKKQSNSVTMKRIHSGESIIDELTKAADEILQALNDYSDDDTSKTKYESQSQKSAPLATISESIAWKDKSKPLEHKAVQTVIGGTRRYNTAMTTKISKTRTSSNSSLESITKEVKVPTLVKKKQVNGDHVEERPEKPHRKKSSSGDVLKARRLQRASSRDALLQVHGSSSEDIAGHLDVARKKTVRRSKHGSESSRKEESRDSRTSSNSQPYVRSIDRKKESSKSSSRYISSLVPEIRHKTTVSTIMNLSDKGSHADRVSEKSKSSSHERSRHRERVREGTISSLARDMIKLKERSRSTDTSLERDNGHNREKYRSRESGGHRRERTHEKSRTSDNDKLKKISEVDNDKEKFILAKKSSVSATNSASVRSIHRGTHAGRTGYDRTNAGGKVTNTRTEYDKNLRLI